MKKTKKVRNKNIIGGVRIFTLDGKFVNDPTILREGKPFFRKMSNHPKEIELCKLLMKHPHENIIKIYDVGNNYLDMELLNTSMDGVDMIEIKKVFTDVKQYLQNLGIIYIDWKLDNIGIGKDGKYKLFDFDASGLINIENNEWIIPPPPYFSYKEAIKNGIENPVDIDNYAFDIGIIHHEPLIFIDDYNFDIGSIPHKTSSIKKHKKHKKTPKNNNKTPIKHQKNTKSKKTKLTYNKKPSI